jgi:hypothetical protein
VYSWSTARQRKLVVIRRTRQAIDTGAGDPEHRTLSPHRQMRMVAIELGSAVRRAHRPNPFAKKSFSIVNWPILACSRSISRSAWASASCPTFGSNARAACSCSGFFQA